MVMTCAAGMGDAVLRERLPALWRRIEDAHYSYLETDDSPEKLQQKKKLEDYIIEYLSLVPHECKFGLPETSKVFQRTINELPEFSAYRAGLGWAALARYAGNLLAQPWRKEYKVIRLYSGYFKHEVEANLVGAETLLHAMGYKPAGAGRLALDAPICPDMVAAISRDALVAQCECQIMSQIWEGVWSSGARVSWAGVCRARAAAASSAAAAAARLAAPARPYDASSEIYSNIPVTVTDIHNRGRVIDTRFSHARMPCEAYEEPLAPVIHAPYMIPPMPHVVYPHDGLVMPPYAVPYYYPVQAPYMIPTPVYAPIKHATNVPVNGYPPVPQYRYPTVPTGQLIELDAPSVYENGKFERREEELARRSRPADSSRTSTAKSLSDVSLPSLPRSDTQPALSKAREDGMGTYESWDYVFRNLSSKEQDGESRSRYSPSLDRDSRTLDRLDRDERRARYQPTTLDLEDGLQALSVDRSHDEDAYRTAKVNENLMRLKQEQEARRARQQRRLDQRRPARLQPLPQPEALALQPTKVAPDKVKLLSKKDVKDRKEVLRQQSSMNGAASADAKKVKKPARPEPEKPKPRPLENGHSSGHTSKLTPVAAAAPAPVAAPAAPAAVAPGLELKAQLVVSLDEPDAAARWQCATCTYLNAPARAACEMCGKSKRGPDTQPLTMGGRECPACTLVNRRDARACDACGTGLDHCPTYI